MKSFLCIVALLFASAVADAACGGAGRGRLFGGMRGGIISSRTVVRERVFVRGVGCASSRGCSSAPMQAPPVKK